MAVFVLGVLCRCVLSVVSAGLSVLKVLPILVSVACALGHWLALAILSVFKIAISCLDYLPSWAWPLALIVHSHSDVKPSTPPQALPPQAEHQKGRITIVLDLDETLIASYKLKDAPAWMHHEDSLASCVLNLPFGPGITDCARAASSKPDGQQQLHPRYTKVMVVQRPGAREFLRRAAAFAELVVFTAAVKEYAEPVVRQVLDPEGNLFQGRLLYRQHTQLRCLTTPSRGSSTTALHCIKDLANLGRDLSRVVLVDNNPISFLHQPANGVPCLPFRGDPSDSHLSTVLLPLLQSLALFRDVRPILDARFQMRSWLTQRGLPVREQPDPLAQQLHGAVYTPASVEVTYSPADAPRRTSTSSRSGSSSKPGLSRQQGSTADGTIGATTTILTNTFLS